MYKVVFDATVWIRYARTKNIAPLLDRMVIYQFVPIVNNYLLVEIFEALIQNKWMDKHDASNIIEYIKRIALVTTERAVYRLSPDPEDNYLFDLCIQNKCVFIITDDTLLLQSKMKPVPVHSTSWFLRKFPVN